MRRYTVTVEETTANEGPFEHIEVEKWYINKAGTEILHRENGPAEIERCLTSGKLNLETWYKEGLRHRDHDKPAYTLYWEDGKPHELIWFKDGLEHRDGAPSELAFNEDGEIYWSSWAKEGKTHRTDGPAIIYKNSETLEDIEVRYYENGELNRKDGPASIERDVDTSIEEIKWYQHGRLHREDGPAVIRRNFLTNSVLKEEYYIWGQRQSGGLKSEPAP